MKLSNAAQVFLLAVYERNLKGESPALSSVGQEVFGELEESPDWRT